MRPKAILFDAVLCQGCGACYNACKSHNNNSNTLDDPLKDNLNADTFTVIEQHHAYKTDKSEVNIFSRKMCMHCIEPACVSVCPVGAMEKTKAGPVIYEEAKCIGCRYCMQACPFKVPRYEWKSNNPKVRKCIMCYERIRNGMQTACADACPFEATIFGDRDDLISTANKRIDANPNSYYPQVYGLLEAGGTSVLFLSPASFDQLGFAPNIPDKSLHSLTDKAIETIPGIVSVGGVFLGSIYWLTKRKNELAKEKKDGSKDEK